MNRPKLFSNVVAIISFFALSLITKADISDPNDWELSVDHTQALTVPDVTPEIITQTVRGLENDPLRIYHYVLNNFDYQLYFGLYKGYERTFYDRAGNDADLCQLLAKMLTIAGYSSEYVEGWMTVPETKLSRWLKTKEDTDGYVFDFNTNQWDDLGASTAIQNALGVANVYYGTNIIDTISNDPVNQIGVFGFSRNVYRICVKVTIDGTEHILDPAFKEYERENGLLNPAQLATLMGYDSTSLLNSLGGTAITNGMQGFDEAALRSDLSGYSSNLKTALLTTYRGKNLTEIFGGHRLVKQNYTTLPTSPSFTFTPNAAPYSDFPHYRKHYFQFKYSTIDVLFATADVNPKRLYLTFDNQRAELFLDSNKIAEESSVGATSDPYFICIDHPYLASSTSIDEEAEAISAQNRDSNCVLVFKHFASTFHDRWFNKVLDETRELRAQGVNDSDVEMLSRNLQLYGIAHNIEKVGFLDLITQTSERANSLLLHDSGVTTQNAGFGMSWLAWSVLVTGYEGWDLATFQEKLSKIAGAVSYYGGALEHNVIDQLQEDQGGISTVRGLSFANNDNQELYFLNQSQYNTLRPTLLSNGWAASTLAVADNTFATDSGAKILIHRDFNLTSPVASHTWTGGVYWLLPSNSIGGFFILDGLTNGGASTSNGIWGYILGLGKALANSIGKVFPGVAGLSVGFVEGIFGFNPTSAEPVDLATGAYLSDHTDLTLGTGALPKGLSLTRSYNSLHRHDNHELGYGWSHSLDSYAQRTTHFPILFGGRLPVDTVAQIVGSYVTADLAEMGQDDIKEVMALMMTSHWATDEIVDNAVTVQTGHQSHIYSRHSDGSFTAPPGVTDTLSLSGNNFVVTERHGNIYNFADVNGAQRLSSVEDQHGNTANFTYDTSHRLSSVSDCFSRSITFNYDGSSGYLDTVTDSTGRSIDYTIDSNGDQTGYTNADNQQFSFVYDNKHQLTEWIDNENRTIAQNVYNSLGQVITQFSEGLSAHEWTFLYTGFENIEQDPLGNQKHYFFDEQLNFVGFEDAEGNRSSSLFNVEKYIVQQIDPAGNYQLYTYNSDLNITNIAEHDASDTLLRSRSLAYDSSKRLQIETNARGHDTSFTYNLKHQILTIQREDEIGNLEFTYNSDGTINWTEDQENNRTTFGYDSHQNPNLITAPDSSTISSVFNARGDVTSSIDARGKNSSFLYNNRRLNIKTTNHDNDFSETTYNGMDKAITVRDFRGNVTTNSYDPLGKITSTDHPLLTGNTLYEYDLADRLISVTTPEGITSTTILDRAGRATSSSDPIATSTAVFDERGLVTSSKNALNQTQTNTYDSFGRMISQANDLSETVTYSYDNNGNRTGIQNARLQNHVFSYDSLDRLTSVTTPDGHSTQTTFTNRHQIDVVTDPSAQTTDFDYNNMGRTSTITDALGAKLFTHDNNGNITEITEGSDSVSYTYDNLNRAVSYTDENGNIIGYGYDENGNMTSITYPGNLTVSYSYDALNRMHTVTDWNGRVTTYNYDEDSRLSSVVRDNGTRRTHTYDTAGRLVKVEELDANNYLIARSDLGLDLAGKVIREFRIPQPKGYLIDTWSATYNSDDEIQTISAGATSYDIDGNITQAPLNSSTSSALSYNVRNQLTAVATANASYTYGIEGRRSSKTVNGVITSYVSNPLGNLATTLMETTGGITRYYIYGQGLIGHLEGGDYHSYHFDHMGNTIALTASDGSTITDRIEYSPYGEITHREGTTETPYLYNGMLGVYSDAESDLVHMRARYYSPYLKRFINKDPIGFAGGMNHHAFAANNPLSFADPSGLGPQSAFSAGRNAGRAAATNTIGLALDAGRSLASGNIVRSIGAILTIPASYLAGDIFGTNTATNSGWVKSVNGIFTNQREAFRLGRDITDISGSKAEVIHNPTTYIGDIIQIIFGEFKIPTISSFWLGNSLNATGGGVLYAHSQGSNVAQLSGWFTNSSTRSNTTVITYGGQTTLTPGNTGFSGATNFGNPGDLVPYFSPWNIGPRSNGLLQNTGNTGLGSPFTFAPHGTANYINSLPSP